jgi:glutamate synthase (NADPH/NADH) small chain
MLPSKARGFMTFERTLAKSDPVADRLKHYREFAHSLPEEQLREQAYRCMNCGVPAGKHDPRLQ